MANENIKLVDINFNELSNITATNVLDCFYGINIKARLRNLISTQNYRVDIQQISSNGQLFSLPDPINLTAGTFTPISNLDLKITAQSARYFIFGAYLYDESNNLLDYDTLYLDCLSNAILLTPTPTETITQTPTNTNTPSVTPTLTNTPSNTATATNTPTNTQSNAPIENYYLAADADFICSLYPPNKLYNVKSISLSDKILCNGEQNLLQLELQSLTVGHNYEYTFSYYFPDQKNTLILSPTTVKFFAQTSTKNIETVIKYTGTNKAVVKLQFKDLTDNTYSNEYFMFECIN